MFPLTQTEFAWPAIAILYLAAQPAWDHFRRWAATWQGRPGACVAALRRRPYAGWLSLVGRFVYHLGIPYAALLGGVADGRRLGLAGLPWWPHLLLGAAVGLAGIGLVAWSWGRMAVISYRRGAGRRMLLEEWLAFQAPWGWVPLLVQALYLQVSWAFVRGATIRLLGLYPGVFVTLALLAGAWLLRPARTEALADPEAREGALLSGGLALVTAVVFLYAENLWLCSLIHGLGLVAVANALGRAYARAKA